MELGLTQEQAAEGLGVNPWTVLNWEKGHTEPPIASLPGILRFLGYNPFPAPRTLPERMLAFRRETGRTIGKAARQLGVDEGTWRAWETGTTIPWPRYVSLLEQFLVARRTTATHDPKVRIS